MAKITITIEDIIKDDLPQITVNMDSDLPFKEDDEDVRSSIVTAKQAAVIAMDALHNFFGADNVTEAKLVGEDGDGEPLAVTVDRH